MKSKAIEKNTILEAGTILKYSDMFLKLYLQMIKTTNQPDVDGVANSLFLVVDDFKVDFRSGQRNKSKIMNPKGEIEMINAYSLLQIYCIAEPEE